ncbi:hypothetical protein KSF_024910 [Reticulibacter mediterranei]|uniref:TPM domain-containing protein n=1 Tax=Reticulibacter mediterranei TaxID=2778369 RepID=A0A8J3IH57_9CHLR|nr:hypothetical protein [Reticulibacter mediterranei]GHO92443.1 hypothetical protein KSF_024910 [Reticulibacter mediterranei]
MNSADTGSFLPVRRLGKGLGALLVVVALMLATTVSAFAATVHIQDNARVLNSQVQSEAQSLSYPVDIYTITNYTASSSQFDNAADSKINSNNLIVIAINTTPGHQHIRITGGKSVPLTSSDYSNAASTFASNFKSQGYSGATIAAIGSLRNALNSRSNSGGGFPGTGGATSGFGGLWCCVGLLVLLGILFFVFRRRRGGGGGGFFNRRGTPPPPPPPYNQPYGPQYGQPPYGGYNQGYPPNQQQGMNPWAAGGLGAAAGGFLGYELGKNAGENENRGDQGGNFGGGGDFGGGGSADFGDNSGGGDFGGGGGSDFGGGGDSGGGGGGSDF